MSEFVSNAWSMYQRSHLNQIFNLFGMTYFPFLHNIAFSSSRENLVLHWVTTLNEFDDNDLVMLELELDFQYQVKNLQAIAKYPFTLIQFIQFSVFLCFFTPYSYSSFFYPKSITLRNSAFNFGIIFFLFLTFHWKYSAYVQCTGMHQKNVN